MKIIKINPSGRLISQKITVQSTFHEASACTWGTSTNLGFHQHRCVFPYSKHMWFKLARENGNECPFFLVVYFWIQQGSLLFDRNKTDRQTNAKRALDSYQA